MLMSPREQTFNGEGNIEVQDWVGGKPSRHLTPDIPSHIRFATLVVIAARTREDLILVVLISYRWRPSSETHWCLTNLAQGLIICAECPSHLSFPRKMYVGWLSALALRVE